ncbi:hypothetical protein HYH03_013199 [Edaphochlamys debaryana]|uniref:Methyltransferase FkbM domain-containing protein n=1 Tax=Edaphochlamys debaryana TaxID=47281 RepID=A0A835XR95_9CHLO|nr:hypothetical protein HYH03_013199 [Edaphochlamys debaryana]|eukprot:KAG2488205.1 hypothetical protein HYH03_013199 [Edaphochlamys debaryana]
MPWEDPSVVGPIRFLQAKDVQIMYTLMKDRCIKKDGSRALFVDVGANFGWYSIIAARLGCRVIGYEPVPLFRSFYTFSTHINDLTGLIDIRPKVVSHERDKTMKMVVPSKGVWGTAGIEGLNIDNAIEASKEEVELPSVRLEDEIKEDVLLMKIDVEGWEWSVIEGAEGLLKNYEVTMDNLKYDVEDIRQRKADTMACPSPPELMKFVSWQGCKGIPEGVSPRSFRSEMGHNTNVHMAKGASIGAPFLRLEGVSGILHPKDPATKYFQTNALNYGMGYRPCKDLKPEVQEAADALAWAAEHENEAAQIAANAQSLALQYLHRRALMCYWFTLLKHMEFWD